MLIEQFVDEGLDNSSYLMDSEETGLAATISAGSRFARLYLAFQMKRRAKSSQCAMALAMALLLS